MAFPKYTCAIEGPRPILSRGPGHSRDSHHGGYDAQAGEVRPFRPLRQKGKHAAQS